MRAVKPQVVMIELCPARRGILTVQQLKVGLAQQTKDDACVQATASGLSCQ